MNKLVLIALGALAGVLAVLFLAPGGGTGIALNEPNFSVNTTTQVACSAVNSSTSLITARQRSSLVIEQAGNQNVYLCRGSGACSATSSFILLPPLTSSSPLSRFVQEDNYSGPYVCRAVSATTSVNVSSAP